MTVKEAQEKIDFDEFKHWQAYYKLDPFGEQRVEFMLAQLCYITASAHAGKGRSFKIDDFMPKYGVSRKQTPEEMKMILKAFTKTHNAILAQKKKK